MSTFTKCALKLDFRKSLKWISVEFHHQKPPKQQQPEGVHGRFTSSHFFVISTHRAGPGTLFNDCERTTVSQLHS